mgnify:CR=1 FL=1
MNQQMDEFLSVGMQRYKQGTAVMISFEEEIHTRLHKILTDRSSDEWGIFVPIGKAKFRRSRTWKEFPHLGAYISGELGDAKVKVTMTIAVNWYQSENAYPFYEIYFWLQKGDAEEEPNKTALRSLKEFPRERQVYYAYEWIDTLRLDPDEDDVNLERDFGILLDELVRFLGEGVG